MRGAAALVPVTAVILAAGVARAKPPRPRDLEDPFRGPIPSCERDKSWPKLRTCLQRGGNTVTMLHELDAAKLVSLRASTSTDTAAVYLYLLRDGVWQKANVYNSINPTNEILSFTRLAKSRAYKLEVGSLTTIPSTLGENRTAQVTLRRVVTTVCLDAAGYCRSMFTRCDALVDGKTLWSFHGELAIDSDVIRITGDSSRAGTLCAPPHSLFSATPLGDPLE